MCFSYKVNRYVSQSEYKEHVIRLINQMSNIKFDILIIVYLKVYKKVTVYRSFKVDFESLYT